MTLGFKQQFPWATKDKPAPTNFREKILAGVGYCKLTGDPPTRNVDNTHSWPVIIYNPKIHTMRADPTNRWKPGRKIEMVYRGAGYKIIDHLNKGIPELEVCTGVQLVKLKWIHAPEGNWLSVHIDGKFINPEPSFYQLAQNDGFKDLEEFCKWFNKDWEGKIIHWTNFRY